MWVAFFGLSVAAMLAQQTSTAKPTVGQSGSTEGAAMQQFVLIFRQGDGGPVSAEEQARRSAAIRDWARKRTAEGYSFDPRALGKEVYRIPAEGDGAGERLVGNLLFFAAKDLDDAVRVAKSHPGATWGTHIEVRAWSAPTPLVAPAK